MKRIGPDKDKRYRDYKPTPEDRAKIKEFFRTKGPYESDVWSGAYPLEILEEIERLQRKGPRLG